MFALGLVCFFWGTTWIASRQGVKYMPPLQLAGIRQLMGGLAYLLYFSYKGRIIPHLREWRPILILGFLNFFLSNGLSTWGVKYINAGLASIIGAAFPLWLVIISLMGGQKKIPTKALIGFGLGFGGICLVFSEHLSNFLNPQFTFGIIISLAATWSWAFGTIYTKKEAIAFNPYFSLGWQMFLSGIATSFVAKGSGMWIPISTIPWQSWTAILYLFTFGSVLSFIAYLYALQNLSAEQTSIYAYINPVVAILIAGVFFGEPITAYILIGGAITLYGVFLINKAFKQEKKLSESVF